MSSVMQSPSPKPKRLPLLAPVAVEQCDETGAESGQEREVDDRVERHVHVGAQDGQVAQWREDGHQNDVQRREQEEHVRERRAEYELK